MPVAIKFGETVYWDPNQPIDITVFQSFHAPRVLWVPEQLTNTYTDSFFTLLFIHLPPDSGNSIGGGSVSFFAQQQATYSLRAELLWGVMNVVWNNSTEELAHEPNVTFAFANYRKPKKPGTDYAMVVLAQPRMIRVHEKPSSKIPLDQYPILDLIRFYHLTTVDFFPFSIIQPMPSTSQRVPYMLPGAPISQKDALACRAVLHTASKQPEWCLRENAWGQKRNGVLCQNPFELVKNAQGQDVPKNCSAHFQFNTIPDGELRAYAALHNLHIPQPYDRAQQLEIIRQYTCSTIPRPDCGTNPVMNLSLK